MASKNKPIQVMQEYHQSASKLGALIEKYCIGPDRQHTDDNLFENKVEIEHAK